MTKLSRRFFAPAALTILLALSGCGGSGSGAKDPSSAHSGEGSGHAEIGQQAPDLTIQTLNGKGTISLESLRGKVVLVDFWATWCAPCKQSFPRLEELSKQVGADKLVIIGVSVDDEKAGVAEFAKETGATFPVGWDEGHTIASKWKFGTMPTTFVVDPSGKIRHIHDGYRDGETNVMSKEITALLDEPSSSGETRVAKSEPRESKPSEVSDDKASHDATAASAKKPKKKGGRGAGKKHPPKNKKKRKG